MERYPIIYIRGYAGGTAGIDNQVDDPFYGFNEGATHIRVDGNGDPRFYQFEGPMLRLLIDHDYKLLVHGDQEAYLRTAEDGAIVDDSIWVYRFYDQAATTFAAPPHRSVAQRVYSSIHQRVTSDGFDIEDAALGLYDLIDLVRRKTGADKVILVAHSMGGLVARCMMQKVCQEQKRTPARELVTKFFTYGTPHGGIVFGSGVLNWLEETVGPAGADIFAPEKMYGYLTPGKTFGDEPRNGEFDPQDLAGVLDTDDVFCLIGTNPKDYGPSKVVVGPKSDGLVRIENAYVRKANRAFVYRSHSGRYGEVNSEEGYQNLRRFLFGRWTVKVGLDGLATLPDDRGGDDHVTWQADLRLSIRGLPVVLSEQRADQYCPIQLDDELRRLGDSPDHPVPLLSTFLLDPASVADVAGAEVRHKGRARYSLVLRVSKLAQRNSIFDFSDHLEQVFDWADSLIVDVGPNQAQTGIEAFTAWNSSIGGAIDTFEPITQGLKDAGRQNTPVPTEQSDGRWRFGVPLPEVARKLEIFGDDARLTFEITDREVPAR
ncbi:esterase/lipase family protein [Gordonia sp. DT101]|uniref:esterase/lipase family protein n=1 Tax=Gordonia sp. DT101 TaxID=3416545 RepID=UPI003CF6253C